jgi:hypothetical protein
MKPILRCLINCCVGLLLLVGCASPGHHSGKWEYKVVEEFNYAGKLEPKLNELAKDGWIVVSSSTSIGPGAGNPMTQVILKRQRNQQ